MGEVVKFPRTQKQQQQQTYSPRVRQVLGESIERMSVSDPRLAEKISRITGIDPRRKGVVRIGTV